MYEDKADLTAVPQQIPAQELIQLVPHKGKMFLLSRITAHDILKNSVCAEYDVGRDCILYDEELGGIPVWAGFEIMAQSISALITIRQISFGQPDTPAPGVILSISGFEARTGSIRAGSTVIVTVAENYRADNVCRYDCEMYEKGDPEAIARTAITVMGIQDMESFFGSLR